MTIQKKNDRLMRQEWKADTFGQNSQSTKEFIEQVGSLLDESDKQDKPIVVANESKDASIRLFDTENNSLKVKKLEMYHQRMGLYTQSLLKIASLCSDSETCVFMQRIHQGLRDSWKQSSKFIEQLMDENKEQQLKSTDDYNKLASEFKDYRRANDLDFYFQHTLNEETKQQTLRLVKELLDTAEENWRDKIKEKLMEYEKYQYSDTFGSLNKLDQEMTAYKDRIRVFEEENA